ncbi:MAG: hypothetical protein ACT4PL_07710 [Phycisphaerales bacterium]
MSTPRARMKWPNRRGFATALVLWAIALAVLILAGLQMSAWRQAADGREAVARVRAQWAARAAIESVVARLEDEATQAQPLGAKSLMESLAADSNGELAGATYRTRHEDTTGVRSGPQDLGGLLNINLMTFDDLMLMPDMTEDAAYAIIDWIDADEDANLLGAEAESYLGLPIPYRPRNGPIRSLHELELVIGVKPEWVRGEDWNLNGLLDPGEDDGDITWPPDNRDGKLDAGWSAIVSTGGTSGGIAPTGEKRLDLATEQASAVAAAVGCESDQADAIVGHVTGGATTLGDFIRTNLSTIAQQNAQRQAQGSVLGQAANANRRTRVANLSREQLGALLDRCTIGESKMVYPGKINLNTVDERTLEYLATLQPTTRDALVLFRDQNAGDIAHLTDLLTVPQMNAATLADLYEKFDVRTNVYSVTAQGRDEATGLVVEITAEVDRSTLPVTIRSVVVR